MKKKMTDKALVDAVIMALIPINLGDVVILTHAQKQGFAGKWERCEAVVMARPHNCMKGSSTWRCTHHVQPYKLYANGEIKAIGPIRCADLRFLELVDPERSAILRKRKADHPWSNP